MALTRITLSADSAGTAANSITINKPRALDMWMATINAYGGFGGGTLSYSLSTDGGTTKTQQKDLTGVAYSTTTADTINMNIGVSSANNANKQVILYPILTGSTNPTLTIDVEDNT